MKKVLLFIFAAFLIAQKSSAQYCTPGFSSPGSACFSYAIDVNNFTIIGELGTSIIDNTGCGGSGWEDNSGFQSVTLYPGNTYTVSVTTGFSGNVDNVQLWIDFNNDLIFQSSETVGGVNSIGGSTSTATFVVTIPSGATIGTTKMRLLLDYNDGSGIYPGMDPCASGYSYGDAHDYTAVIAVPPPAVITAPTSLAFGGVTSGTSSLPQTFTVTGSSLVPATGTFTVTAPANFQVSSDGITWVTTYTIPYSGSSLSATTVYVQFDPIALTTYSGNVTIAGGGLTSPANEPITGTGATACSGTPTAGTAIVAPTYGNATTPFALSLSGSTVAGGITYQWQSSPDGITYTNMPGATLASYGFTGISANTYYQCIETCPSFATATSTSAFAAFIPAPTCLPTSASWSGESGSVAYGVDGFNITGFSGSTLSDVGITSAADPSTGYLDRTSMTPVNLQPGSAYASAAYFGSLASAQEVQVWIDFNDNGTFEPSEEVSPVAGYSSSFTSYPVNFNITIPLTSTPGNHLMRMRGIWEAFAFGTSLSTDLDPCLVNFGGSSPYYYSGTVADYVVNILPAPPTVTTTPPSLAFGGVTVGTSSSLQTFTVTGSYLVPSTGSFTVTAPPNFQVSSDGITWVGSYSIPYTGSALSATTVYVQFDPTAYTFYSDVVAITGGGLSSAVNEPVNGTGAAACSGTPTAGAAVVAPTYGNITTPFALSLSGSTIAGGITYQWQSSPDGITYSDIPGATLAGYSFTGISASTYYECVQTCPTFATATSTSALATYIPSPACLPSAASWTGESGSVAYGVDGFNITGFSGSTLSDVGITSAADPSTGYLDRTSMTPVNLQPGSAYASAAYFGSLASAQEVQVWIDFNDNGTFEPSEEVSPVAGYSSSFTSYPVNFNITIPLTSTPGNHLMRMRGIWEAFAFGTSLSTDLDPCLVNFGGSSPYYYSGTVADYVVNILPAPPTVTTTPPSLAFGGVTVGTSSSLQTFTVTGSYLVPSTGSFTVTAPPNFQVSSDGITWVGSYSIPYTGSALSATTVYVQFDPTAYTFYSDVVAITGGGLSSAVNEPVNGTGAAACSGTPTAGAAVVAPTYGNITTPFALSLSGSTIAGGITYQWQSSPDGITYSDIPGATLAGYSFTGISASTYYECVQTCPTFATATSTSALATFIPSPTCLPTSASWTGESGSVNYGVDGLNITGFSGSTLSDVGITSAADPSTGYLDRTSMTPVNLEQSGVYATAAYFGSLASAQEVQVWIDFNDNGTFEPSEEVSPVAGYNSSFTSYPVNFNITIPLTATPGNHLMRMRGIWEAFAFGTSLSTDLDPCLVNFGGSSPYYYSGTVADYVVNIVQLPPCSGMPTAGTISATASTGCAPYTTTLSLPGATTGVGGLTYQWQTSPDCTTWTPVAGATNATYTASVTATINYNCIVTCTVSALGATTPCYNLILNTPPAPVTGTTTVCNGNTSTLSSATSGGTWSSSDITIATVDPTLGTVTGVGPGVANIIYTIPSGCTATTPFIVNPVPSSITITPGTSVLMCTGDDSTSFTASSTVSSITIMNETFNSGLDGWSVINTGATSIYNWANTAPGSLSDISYVTGDGSNYMASDADLAGPGVTLTTSLISPAFSTVGYDSVSLSYNEFYSNYFADVNVEVDYSTDGGTTWTTVVNQLGTGDYNSTWTVGVPNITVPLPVGALGQPNVMLRWYYNTTFGNQWVIDNVVVTANSNLSYMWTGISGATGLSCTACASPTITPTALGTNVYSVTASAYGCSSPAAGLTITLNPSPAAITGTLNTCAGNTSALSDITSGGTWSSSNTSVASVDVATGVVTGVAAGTATISYASSGCPATVTFTVNDVPGIIAGTLVVCTGATTTLSDPGGTGTWTSSDLTIATVGSSSGIVTGIAAGTVNITFANSCGAPTSSVITVNQTPAAITGPSIACMGSTTTLSDATTGGTWNSSDPTIATIDPVTGIVTPVAPGSVTIGYTLGNGCVDASTTEVINIPPSVTASVTPTSICPGGSANLAANASISDITLLSEDFNAGLGGFTVVNLGSSSPYNWAITAPYSWFDLSVGGDGSNFVGANSDLAGAGVNIYSQLVSPSFSTVGYTAASISFNHYLHSDAFYDVTAEIDYSVDGGSTWSLLYDYFNTTTGSTSWTSGTPDQTIVLPPAAIGQPNVMVRWNYNTTYGWQWVVDNVVVSATPDLSYTWSPATFLSSTTASNPTATAVTATTTYTVTAAGSGCSSSTNVTLTVNPIPSPIAGNLNVCTGLTTSLSDADLGGTWSSSDITVASIDISSGLVTGVSAVFATATITYTLPTGCTTTAVVTVNPLPSAITGTMSVCIGLTTALTDATSGGTWSSSSFIIASVGASTGVVTGLAGGNAIVTYTLPTGCITTTTVTVNPLPTAITGTLGVCAGLTTTLNSTPGGGTWASSNGNVIVGPSSGVVTGLLAGTSVITYTLPTGCITTVVVTINPIPSSITGTLTVCAGLTTALTDATTGGTWTSGNTTIATIGSSSGVVTGVAGGISTITYTVSTGCITTVVVTVNPLPTGITGTLAVCAGLTSTLNSTPAGGTWTSSNANVSIGSGSGVVTGLLVGTSTITYTLPTGCIITAIATVNPLPSAITGTLSVCAGLTTNLTDGSAGGSWTSSATTIATIGSGSGVVTGVLAGTSTIIYTLPTGCNASAVVTVDPLPTAITGTLAVCAGLTSTLNSTPAGGTWTSSNANVSIGSGSGVVTGLLTGTSIITYTLPTGCIITAIATVNPLPTAITGTMTVCQGLTTNLTDGLAGGTWTSSNTTVATVGSGSGVVTGILAGTTTITYTLPTGCNITATITVNPLPMAVTGTLSVCAGLTTNLTDGIAGGTWTSGNTTVATIGSSSGVVTGILAGTSVITYTLSTGCITTAIITVNPLPAAITGSLTVCTGLTTTLTDGLAGGTWISNTTTVATIGLSSGVATGVLIGTSVITYTLPTGCTTTAILTVNTSPAPITGTLSVCVGATSNLTDGIAGGVWNSSNTSIATVGSSSGIVTGVLAGTATIIYTLPSGCNTTIVFTVNPLPTAISGSPVVCAGSTTNLSDGIAGGTWVSGNTAIATVGSGSGVVTGIAAGTSIITYTTPGGCTTTITVTVHTTPTAITGVTTLCAGSTTNLTDGVAGGVWNSSNTSVATVGSGSGIVTGISGGNPTIIYTLPTGCTITTVITVNPLPSAISGSLGVCQGLNTNLTDGLAGGTWASSATSVATVGSSTGVVNGLLVGTSTITYTLPTGCSITAVVTVNSLPAAITGTLSVCQGLTTNLTDAVSGGTWSSSNTTVATVGSSSGVVTSILAGTTTITYTLPTGCTTITNLTVNQLPAVITGSLSVCAGSTTNLTDGVSGGTWSSSTTTVATIGSSSGIVTGVLAGTSTITYTLPTGCTTTAVLIVNPLPSAITGTLALCQGLTSNLTDAVTGGTWGSSNTAVATVGSSSGVVTGILAGTATIVYTLPTGCSISADVTVNPLPSAITGTMGVCQGSTTGLSDAITGGTWSSSNTAIATVGSSSGIVTGVLAGTTTITYTLPTGCIATANVIVNPLPSSIIGAGAINVCTGLTVALTDITTGGTWSSSDTTIVNISGTGVATGATSGTATITYTLPTGCMATTVVTVDPLPSPITGIFSVCTGLTVTLTDGAAGGTWSSSNMAVISIGSSTGVASTLAAGTATITYTLPTGCTTMAVVTVNPLPSVITGPDTVCVGFTSTYTDSLVGGFWSTSDTSLATANATTGVVTGVAAGTVTVTYTSATGCIATITVSVNICPSGVPVVVSGVMDVRVFPNPNKGEFTIKGSLGSIDDKEITLEITDMLGQIIYKNKVMTHNGILEEHVQLSNTLANGMYMLNLRTGIEFKTFHFVVEQ